MRRPRGWRTLTRSLATVLLTILASVSGGLVQNHSAVALPPGPFLQCPSIGWDVHCEILITINPDGSVTTQKDPGEGSFDGVDDTLIGVQNNSTFGIRSMDLTGTGAPFVGPFNFDNDGICQLSVQGPNGSVDNTSNTFFPQPPGCPFGPTRYEGPGTAFTNYSPATGCPTCTGNTGTVLFTGSGLRAGTSTYFSLEGKVTPGIIVVIDPPITARGLTFNATEGQTFSGAVATFTDPDPKSTATEYIATIDWGDSSTSAGTISGPTGGPFTVSGTHMYAEEGGYAVTVTITDVDNLANNDTANSRAAVGDAPIVARCPTPLPTPSTAPPVSLQAFAGTTAIFNDSSATGTLSDFSATINWGDASSSPGTVAGGPGLAPYTVSGTHAYSSTGTFTVTTAITDVGGASAKVQCQLIVFAFATQNGAAFVIGDLEDGIGNHVTWWSSQWANINLMSQGAPPDAMKGFAGFEDNFLGLPPPNCGGSWSTDPGNSTPPPGSVPDTMGVIVSSQVTKQGSVITGDIKRVVIVKNDPGYQPSPGHDGTGTEIAIFCALP